jgi:hypothetical protein
MHVLSGSAELGSKLSPKIVNDIANNNIGALRGKAPHVCGSHTLRAACDKHGLSCKAFRHYETPF